MPGIVGFVSDMPAAVGEALLKRMLDTIRPESFYETGAFVDENLGLYVGWAARKDSFCESMPVRNETGEVVLVFSGEEFSESAAWPEHGHHASAGRASYLTDLYEKDPCFPRSLNGVFQGVVID